MKLKQGDIVITTSKARQKTGSLVYGIDPGVVCEITFVTDYLPAPYHARYLSKGEIGCAGVFAENELKLASPTTRRKYNKAFIRKLFGRCDKKGCTNTCKHLQ